MSFRIRACLGSPRLSRRGLLKGTAALGGIALSGCALDSAIQTGPGLDAPPPDVGFTPGGARIGTGPVGIGVLAFDQVGNLSGGAPGSVYQCAQLALKDLATDKVSMLVEDATTADALARSERTILAAAPGAIVGPGSDDGARILAKAIAGKPIAVFDLARVGDPAAHIYGAGRDFAEEASICAQEMKRRGYTSVVIATAEQAESKPVGAALAAAAGVAGIVVRPAHIPTPEKTVAILSAAVLNGQPPSAIAFATSPDYAMALHGSKGPGAGLANLPIVGNSGWGMAYLPPDLFAGAWYPTLPLDALKRFADKFAASYSGIPTIEGAIAYDLTLLAAALPQAAGANPYRPAIITSEHGFVGQTGPFRFDPDSGLARRQYSIATV